MKKIFTLVVAIFMLLAILTACNDGNEPAETSDSTESIETTVETTEETTERTTEDTTDNAQTNTVSIFKDGNSEFTIVQPDSPDDAISKVGISLKNAFKRKGATTVNFYKEGMYKTMHNGTIDGHKIVIDVIDEENCKEIFDSFDGYYYPYAIKMINGSLYIVGGSAEATVTAVNYFIDTYLSEEITSLELEKDMDLIVAPEPPIPNLTVNGNSIYNYTIVHCDSYYAEQAAYNIQDTLIKMVGKELPVIRESVNNPETELEILVGKTGRDESKSVRAEYDRPNVNYDIAEVNGKLVIMAEGFSTLKEMEEKIFPDYLDSLGKTHDIVGSAVSGDIMISDNADNIYEGNMLTRHADTEVRVMAWNMGGPGTSGKVDLSEKLADAILKNLPDVFGTNEFYDPPTGGYRVMFNTVLKEISEYYYEIESDYDFPDDPRLETYPQSRGPRPQKIFVRKDAGIKVIDAGWRYANYTESSYRSFPWAVLETKEGNKFIYTVSHYTDMYENDVAAIEQLEAIDYAQKQSGCNYILPAIISGDLYTRYTATPSGAYAKFLEAGYKDAQRSSLVNANNNISHSTFHDYGVLQPTGRADLDLIFCNAGFRMLQFKVITSREALDSSDHSPVCVDLAF